MIAEILAGPIAIGLAMSIWLWSATACYQAGLRQARREYNRARRLGQDC